MTDILVKYFRPMTREEDWTDLVSKTLIIILLVEPLLEATYCENRLENNGGHALFDSWIVFTEFVLLALSCYRYQGAVKKNLNE